MEKPFKITTNLDKAAFLLLQGASIVSVGRNYFNEIELEITKEMLEASPVVDYKKYMSKRRKLKERLRESNAVKTPRNYKSQQLTKRKNAYRNILIERTKDNTDMDLLSRYE